MRNDTPAEEIKSYAQSPIRLLRYAVSAFSISLNQFIADKAVRHYPAATPPPSFRIRNDLIGPLYILRRSIPFDLL